jgi:membrane protein implicated in regulation of membrane protease activity
MSYITEHLAQTLMVLGILALIIEVAVLGLSTFVLLFLGLSLFLSGVLISLTLLPDTLTSALWSNVLLTSLFTVVLWKPLKRMQNKVDSSPVNSDFAQLQFELAQDVSAEGLTTHQYSGITWQLKSEQPILAGSMVKVFKKEVGVMWVSLIDSK